MGQGSQIYSLDSVKLYGEKVIGIFCLIMLFQRREKWLNKVSIRKNLRLAAGYP